MEEQTQQTQPKETLVKRVGPSIFWGAVIALPAMNLAAAAFNWRAGQLIYATELLKLQQMLPPGNQQ